jgi:hypothetical protein
LTHIGFAQPSEPDRFYAFPSGFLVRRGTEDKAYDLTISLSAAEFPDTAFAEPTELSERNLAAAQKLMDVVILTIPSESHTTDARYLRCC